MAERITEQEIRLYVDYHAAPRAEAMLRQLLDDVERLRAEVQEWKESRERSFREACELHTFLGKSENEVQRLRRENAILDQEAPALRRAAWEARAKLIAMQDVADDVNQERDIANAAYEAEHAKLAKAREVLQFYGANDTVYAGEHASEVDRCTRRDSGERARQALKEISDE